MVQEPIESSAGQQVVPQLLRQRLALLEREGCCFVVENLPKLVGDEHRQLLFGDAGVVDAGADLGEQCDLSPGADRVEWILRRLVVVGATDRGLGLT